ncbi:MAG: 16S rRNA processing protein RimM [Bacteroidetes bacterium CG2_30_32_10]|nr:MAG: 16S rRNA processing protein RimM [Bacteroidetes bacterium CG2_30_32_10]
MLKNDCFELGHISKTSGFRGALVFMLDVDVPENYKKLESVFIDINEKLVPFFVKSFHLPKNSRFATVQLENVNDIEQAKPLIHHKLFLPLTLLAPLEGNQFYYHEIIGFDVIDEVNGNIGKVTSIIDMPHYAILQVDANGKEVLIPAIKDIIIKLDRNNKVLSIKAPEGLIEIYTK